MAHLTSREYDSLERAITEGRRIAVVRRGREFVVVPLRLYMQSGREIIDTRHPTTGDPLTFTIDEVECIEVVLW